MMYSELYDCDCSDLDALECMSSELNQFATFDETDVYDLMEKIDKTIEKLNEFSMKLRADDNTTSAMKSGDDNAYHRLLVAYDSLAFLYNAMHDGIV